MVTDLGSAHNTWFDWRSDYTFVPSTQLEDMEAFSSRLEAEREQREEMEKKLRHMESRLLGSKGVDDLIAQKEEKEAVLEERHRELRHRRSSVVLTQEKIAELEKMQALKDQEEKSLADEAVAISKSSSAR